MTQLSAQQLAGIEQIKTWYASAGDFGADVFRLFGPAGTGKTTMAKAIPAALGLTDVRYATFTGKAAHVLRSKGATPVSTIHSGIYMPTTSLEARAALQEAREELDLLLMEAFPDAEKVDRVHALEAQLPELEAAAKRIGWEWNPDSEWATAQLIILDEVSMVNAKLASDIEAYDVPILVLGDPAQLPPVEGGGYYTDAKPDFLLTEIHRSALDNPITALATRIRQSTNVGLGLLPDEMEPVSLRRAMQHDQVLVWTNKRRWSMIKHIRQQLGRPEFEVVPGDMIMCLTNNKDLAVFNGQQFEVIEAKPGTLGPTLTVVSDEGRTMTIPVFQDGFMGREQQELAKRSGSGLKGNRMLATFSQAITVHKAQGSEWESVYVVNETPGMISMGKRDKGTAGAIEQARQWMYTAATRARTTVTITAPR